ncbi:MAG: hypothetical protein IJ689_02380 [Alphaproteobacteria bacterium]|nr:hypothetical protein [Alphaproteobacteria bacterium]
MKNYILMLGVAGVAFGTYAAYADNSATMTVTATIAHDVSLTVTQDIDFGTITINPGYTGSTSWQYSYESGAVEYIDQGAIVSADDITFGTFTANIPNPSACNMPNDACGGLDVSGNEGDTIYNLFGGSDNSNYCYIHTKYTGSDHNFIMSADYCAIYDISKVTTGSHTGTVTISYTPS